MLNGPVRAANTMLMQMMSACLRYLARAKEGDRRFALIAQLASFPTERRSRLALCSTWYALPNMRLSLGCLHRSDDLSGQNIKNGRSGATQDSDCKYCTNHGRCGLLNMGCELADDFGLSIHVEEFCADAQIDLVSEDRLLVVKSGVVKTIHLDTHRRFRVIGFSFPGDLIGLEVLAGFNHSGVATRPQGR